MSAATIHHLGTTTRCSQGTHASCVSPQTLVRHLSGRVVTRSSCRGRSAVACQTQVAEPCVRFPEQQFAHNSIVTFTSTRRQDEVSHIADTPIRPLLALAANGLMLHCLQSEQPPAVPLIVGLCDELCAACQRQPEVRDASMTPHGTCPAYTLLLRL